MDRFTVNIAIDKQTNKINECFLCYGMLTRVAPSRNNCCHFGHFFPFFGFNYLKGNEGKIYIAIISKAVFFSSGITGLVEGRKKKKKKLQKALMLF